MRVEKLALFGGLAFLAASLFTSKKDSETLDVESVGGGFFPQSATTSQPPAAPTVPAPVIVAQSGPYVAVLDPVSSLTYSNYGRTPGAPAAPVDPLPGVNLAGIATQPSPFAQTVNVAVAQTAQTPESIRAAAEAALAARWANNGQGGVQFVKTYNPDVYALELAAEINRLTP